MLSDNTCAMIPASLHGLMRGALLLPELESTHNSQISAWGCSLIREPCGFVGNHVSGNMPAGVGKQGSKSQESSQAGVDQQPSPT